MIKPIYICGPKMDSEKQQDFIYKNFGEEFKLKPDAFIFHNDPDDIPKDAQYIYIIKSKTDEAKWIEFNYMCFNKGYTPVVIEDF